MATSTTNEADDILASVKTLVGQYDAKGPTRPSLTFWDVAQRANALRFRWSSALLELGGETDAHAHLEGITALGSPVLGFRQPQVGRLRNGMHHRT